MSWVAVGVAGAALIGGMMQSNASQNAAQTQADAANNATNAQWQMYNQTRADQQPWRQAGAASLGQLMWLLGISPGQANTALPSEKGTVYDPNLVNSLGAGGFTKQALQGIQKTGGFLIPGGTVPGYEPGGAGAGYDPSTFGSLTRPFSMSDFQQDPGYAFRMKQGLDALDRSGSAAGMTLSGAQLKALTDYGQGMGSQEFGNAWNRWHTQNTDIFNRFASVAGLGQQANSILANVGMNTANQIGGNYNAIGNANAAGAIGSANAWGNALNGAGNAFMNQYYMQGLMNGGWGNNGQAILNKFGNGPGGWNAPQTIPVE